MKRILLIALPFYRLMGSHYNGLHLGIAYIAAVLKEHGHQVKIYNADYSDTSEYLNQRQLFDNYPSYKQILNDPADPIWDEVRNAIFSFAPDFIGITMMTANYKAAKNVARIAKSLNSGIRVVVGGAHPTLDLEGTLAEEEFDYVIRGEGEFALLELLNGQKEDEIRGLSFKKSNQPIHNESRAFIQDLDSLPFPNRDAFLNDTKYLDVGYVSTGRGCPFSCAYCASPQLWQRVVRFRSISNITEELRYLKEKFDSPLIHFTDDTFNLNRHRTSGLCQRIIDERLELKWICDARVDKLDKELVSLMVRAGCIRIKLGVESGSDRILKMINKGFNTETIRRGVAIVKEHGLPLTVYLMIGFPGETNKDLRQTIKLARELDAHYYSLSVLAPYYGTQIWKELEEAGKMPDKEHWEYFYHQSQEMIVNNELDPAIVDEFLALNERKEKGRRI